MGCVTDDGAYIDDNFEVRFARYPRLIRGIYFGSMESAKDYLANRIQELIDDGRSPYWIADKCKVSRTTIDNILNRRGNFSVGTISNIVHGLELDIHEVAHLCFGIDKPDADDVMTGILREMCELAIDMDKKSRQQVLDFMRYLSDRK